MGNYENDTYNILEKYIYDFRYNLAEYRRYTDDNSYVKATYTYNSFNRVLTEQVYDTTGTEVRKTEYTYSFSSNKVENITTAKVSGGGRNFAVNERKTDYFGRQIYEKQTDANSNVRQYDYITDYLGNILSVTKPDYSTESYVYGHLGNVTDFTNAAGDTMHYAYDMAGNNISVTDYNGNTTSYVYDVLGRKIKTVAPFSNTATSTTKTYYDANGNVIKKAVQNNAEGEDESYRTVDYAYDNMNRLSYTVEHPTVITNEYTQYFYDANGNVQNIVKGLTSPIQSFSQRPSSSKYLTYSYDALNRNTVIRGTLSASDKYYSYDRSDNVVSSRKGSNTVNYTYDPFGNVLTIQGGTDASKYISYSYNALGLRSQMVDETGTTNYAYNDFGELISETKGGIVKTSGYNNMGMRTSFGVTSDGNIILSNTYSYDNLGRMTSVSQSGDTVSYIYDKNSNLLQRSVNGISAVYTYNKANLRISEAIGVPTDNVQYTYYLDGNKKSRINSFLQNEYEYDNKSRLISSSFVFDTFEATYESFEYDKYDDIRKKIVRVVDSYGYEPVERNFETFYDYYPETRLWMQDDLEIVNGKNTLMSYSDTYYDENGNISRKESYDSSHNLLEIETYQFDYLNRLTSVANGTDVYSYTYDGNNLRQSKTVNGDTTIFILDGMDVVADFGSQNDKTFLRGNGLEGYLKDGSNRKFYYNETNESVYRVYDFNNETNSFNYVSQYFYGGYGNTIWNSWTETSFKFAGEYQDDETGFIYLRNRYYDPNTGRFISEDPAMDGLNWYAYCNNNPVNFVDPTGYWAEGDELYPQFIQDAIYKYTVDWEIANEIGNVYGMDIAHNNAKSARELGDSFVAREDWGAIGVSNMFGSDPNKHTIVIHHTVGEKSINEIEKDHIKEGFGTVGYHFVIGTDGTVYEGTPLENKGAHVDSYNTGLIGISLIGNFEPSWFRNNSPEQTQLLSMIRLVQVLQDGQNIYSVKGHRDYNGVVEGTKDTVCPGQNLYDIIVRLY